MKESKMPPEISKNESFLARFSRRKLVAGGALKPIDSSDPTTLSTDKIERPNMEDMPLAESLTEASELTDDDMPPIETLTEDSDYRGFLSPRVSKELQKLALRKLFHGAAFNVCDGLDDYTDDFTAFAKLGDLVTSDMRFQAEEALKKLNLEQEFTEPKQDLEQLNSATTQDEERAGDNLPNNDEFEESEIKV